MIPSTFFFVMGCGQMDQFGIFEYDGGSDKNSWYIANSLVAAIHEMSRDKKSKLDEIKNTIYEQNDRTLHGSIVYTTMLWHISFVHKSISSFSSIPFLLKKVYFN